VPEVEVAEVELDVGGLRTSASVHGQGRTAVVLGHGAGSDRRQAPLVRLAEAIASSGRRALLFNFPYREAGRRLPDRAELLEATVVAVAAFARGELGAEHLVLGGRSMGGRIASQALASGLAADGLVLLAYPLHPPGRPERLRDRHLGQIACPMLFVQGTRDAFARWDLLTAVLARLGSAATLATVRDGDHAFAVPRRTGEPPAEVEAAIHTAVLDWLAGAGL
jgi:hypothetical protein